MENSKDTPVQSPRLFSKNWWLSLGSALNFKSYDAKNWAVWNLSTYVTLINIFAGKALWTALTTKLPWLMPMISAAYAKVASFFSALMYVIFAEVS